MPTTIKGLKVGDSVYLGKTSTQEQQYNKWSKITKVGIKYVYVGRIMFKLENDEFKFNVDFLGHYPYYLALNEDTIQEEMKRVKLLNYLEKEARKIYPIFLVYLNYIL